MVLAKACEDAGFKGYTDHASRIRVVRNLMKSTEELKNFDNEKVEERYGRDT